jgi:hypothetical protein
MNWLETSYPSPAFPNTQRSAPGVGSTHYFAAYTCVHGSYPPLKPRINLEDGAPAASPGDDEMVLRLLDRVEITGHKDRPAFAPRITIRMTGGTIYQGEFQGNELEWDFDTERQRVTAIFKDMDWPAHKLQGIVDAVSTLEDAPTIDPLIQLCVRG